MDTIPLVDNQIDDGQRLLTRLAREGFDVRAACWGKPVDEDCWSLYLATPVLDEKGMLGAYGELGRIMRPLGDMSITSADVKLIGAKHPMVQAALDLRRRFPHKHPMAYPPTPSPSSLLGGIPLEGVYVYPLREVEVTVYGLVFRGEPGGVLHLSLEPHNPHSTLTVESNGTRHVYRAETGIDWVVAAPEGAKLERDAAGDMVLVWNFQGNRTESSANEVWSLAHLGLHGFRFLREPA